MNGQILKILFYDDNAYITQNRSMTFAQLGLPPIAKSFKYPAIWTIRVIRYIEDQKKIYCNIISYENGETEFGFDQVRLQEKLDELEIITFRSIDTDALLKTLAGSVAMPFTRLPDAPVERHNQTQIIREPLLKSIQETHYIPIKNVHFNNGSVTLVVKCDATKKTVQINIANDMIKEEFDAVKNYIGNVLGAKTIQVYAKFELFGDKMTLLGANSPEISKIDSSFFEKVKFEVVKSVLKKSVNFASDKALLTIEELFEKFTEEELKSKLLYNDAVEMLEDVLKISNTKHYNHLRYLSSKHSHQQMKLRFVHNPFSFVFLIAGKNNFHIIWETLDTTQATYIWHLNKDPETLNQSLYKIEQDINIIKNQGRKTYLKSSPDSFIRIFHEYSENVEGFLKWKRELVKALK